MILNNKVKKTRDNLRPIVNIRLYHCASLMPLIINNTMSKRMSESLRRMTRRLFIAQTLESSFHGI